MRFGFCASAEQSALIAAAGYDYLEWPLAPMMEIPTEETVLAGLKLQPEAFNVFLPGDLKVVGTEVDPARQTRYLESAFARAAALGGKVVVFGSGRSRRVPDGFEREIAERQTIEFLRRCAPPAAAEGITLVIEPLNTGECNHINSVAEAVALAQAVDHPAVRVLSDLYHVSFEGQSYGETRAAGSWLHHVHVAGAEGRRVPNAEDVDYLAAFFRVLKESDYSGRISVEGTSNDLPREAAEALAVLHRAWEIA